VKIFQIHNYYKYYGGEDTVVNEEANLLKSNKIEVFQIFRENKLEISNFAQTLNTLKNLRYSKKSIEILKKYLSRYGRPDLVHIHNVFPLWTYSILEFFKNENIPMVLTLHNYRIIWEKLSIFDKDFRKFGTYKNSIIQSYLISKIFNLRKDLLKNVDFFVTHTNFTKEIFVRYGLESSKIKIIPNFLPNLNKKIKTIEQKKNVLFASRISKEKGILTLIKAWRLLDNDIDLDVCGEGPLLDKLNKLNDKNIKFLGNLPKNEIRDKLHNSKFLIFPSEWYESFPMTILEAFREGTLVLASNIGSIKSIIKDKYNGILFEPGNTSDLIDKVKWILNNQKECDQIALNANNEFNKKYSSEVNYKQLIDVYQKVIKDNEN
jgi:glycosyltransferase involved in cell wall biosynthesis